MRKLTRAFAPIVFVLSLLLSSCALPMPSSSMVSMDELPAYSDSAYVEIDGNQPSFTDADKQETEAFEEYSDLDYLGRCGTAYANVGQELMPADGEKRGSIGQVKPTGWHTVKYDCVDGKYLYNRCHLIGWQLTAENANKQNLITGTRYLNIEGISPFNSHASRNISTSFSTTKNLRNPFGSTPNKFRRFIALSTINLSLRNP